MKRISLWLILLALTPGIAEARRYTSSYYRTRYSPYALRYGSSGLVQGRLDYSLHAFDYGSSALVSWDTRYTPYTSSYGNSGLIADYHGTYGVPYPYRHPAYLHPYIPIRGVSPIRADLVRPPVQEGYANAHATTPSPSVVTREATEREPDGLDIIRRHLRAKGVDAVGVNRILRIDDTLVSADVIAGNRNVLIKYWNPEAIRQLDAKEPSKQNVYERYRQDWEGFAAEYRRNGGVIYSIMATDAPTIVVLLDCCTGLDAEYDEPSVPAIYARN